MFKVRKKLHDQGGSLFVLLPKIWTDAKGLEPHDVVEIYLNDELRIVPVGRGRN